MPEKPKALSPSIAITGFFVVTAAATAKPMPMPMIPQVPTSRRFLGSYMSTIERAKSSVFAPSLTTIASGFALTTSRITLSALWKLIGDGFLASVSAILARFFSLRSPIAPVQSAPGLAHLSPRPFTSAATHEPMSPTSGAAIGTLLSISVGEMSTWMNLRSAALAPPQVLPLPCESSQLRRAPISITTSASASTYERVDDLDQRALACRRVDRLREELGREVGVDAAGTAGHGRADRARDADADVFGME